MEVLYNLNKIEGDTKSRVQLSHIRMSSRGMAYHPEELGQDGEVGPCESHDIQPCKGAASVSERSLLTI